MQHSELWDLPTLVIQGLHSHRAMPWQGFFFKCPYVFLNVLSYLEFLKISYRTLCCAVIIVVMFMLKTSQGSLSPDGWDKKQTSKSYL